MIIGVPKEVMDNEYRVAVVPSGVKALVDAGARVLVQRGAGEGSALADDLYAGAGAELTGDASEVYGRADLVCKVKEPQPSEYGMLRPGLVLFGFLHLAAKRRLVEELVERGVTAVAYETIEEPGRGLPVLKPMSEVAGRLAVQIGAHYLTRPRGGRGVLLGGVPGVERGEITVIGAGTVGVNALRVAAALGADVTVLDVDVEKFRRIEEVFGARVKTLVSNAYNIERAVRGCDLLIGAVHRAGARTPVLVKRELVSQMRKGAVVVDVAVDQGGCVETIRPTTHSEPVYEEEGVLHYGVANIPGAVPRTSTFALTNATLPYLLDFAARGAVGALNANPALASGVNVHDGRVTHRGVADSLRLDFSPFGKKTDRSAGVSSTAQKKP
ncbi:MAG TPA: alanine dehydrogenase [Deltaproteobacteria bacterium]|nr:alanine dehydrogenase [Deltaproteobacteria bacterium]